MAQTPLFSLIFPGLGWPWVGEFVGFIMILTCFATPHNLVNRKHRTNIYHGICFATRQNLVSRKHPGTAHEYWLWYTNKKEKEKCDGNCNPNRKRVRPWDAKELTKNKNETTKRALHRAEQHCSHHKVYLYPYTPIGRTLWGLSGGKLLAKSRR